MMRLKSDIFVSALIRRVFADGGFAAVEASGSPEAGAIFVRCRYRDGTESLFGPAPQSIFEDREAASDRLFELRLERAEHEKVHALLARERNFDSDLWIVEIEADDPLRYLGVRPA